MSHRARSMPRNVFMCKKKVYQNKKSVKIIAQGETVTIYTASCGVCVRTGRRQSIPSSNIASCAGVKDTVPLVALRPEKSSSLKSLREKTQPVAIEPQNFDQITASSAKDIHLARKWAFLERRLHHSAQPCKSAPHVRHSGDDPNPRPRCQPDHRSKCSSTRRSASPSTLPVTQTMSFGKFHLDRARYSGGDWPASRSMRFAGLRLTYMHWQQV